MLASFRGGAENDDVTPLPEFVSPVAMVAAQLLASLICDFVLLHSYFAPKSLERRLMFIVYFILGYSVSRGEHDPPH